MLSSEKNTNNMKDTFKNICIENILFFLKEIKTWYEYNSEFEFLSTNLPLKETPNPFPNKQLRTIYN